MKKVLFRKNKEISKTVVINYFIIIAFYLALIIIFTFTPYTGYIRILFLDFTTLPVFIVLATVHIGRLGGTLAGTFIGFGSLFLAYAYGDPSGLFYNIDIAIVPRFLAGLIVSNITYYALKKDYKFIYKLIVFAICAALTAIFNTTLVSAFIFLHNYITPFDWLNNNPNILYFWVALIWVNFLFEILVAVIIGTALFRLMLFMNSKHSNLKLISL